MLNRHQRVDTERLSISCTEAPAANDAAPQKKISATFVWSTLASQRSELSSRKFLGHLIKMEDQTKHSNAPEEQQQLPADTSASLSLPQSIDNGSDFYNTPLTGQTPVYSAAPNSNANSVPSTPQKPASEIPGLSFLNNSDQAQQPEVDAKNKAASSNDDQVMVNAPEAHELSQTTSQTAENSDAEAQNGNIETGDMMETVATANVQTEKAEEEHPEWEVDSSPYESSTDSSTDSSDDSDDDDEEDYPILTAEETARILMRAEGGSDDEGEGKSGSGTHIKTANEKQEEVAPIPDISVTPDMKIVLLGQVESTVENLILIRANVSGDYQVLESNSLLCLEDRTVIGTVADTLGRVEEPLYTVRFQDSAKIKEFGLTSAKPVYYVESHSTFVFTQALKGIKGSDASNFHDEEVAEDEVEFSDDEAEAEYKRRLKQKKKERREGKTEGPGGKGRKEPPSPSRLRQSELNYDDEDGGVATEDGYTPLARPTNYHEMMGHQEAPVEGPQGFRGRGNFRGRGRGGRGFDRGSGRGGRGRGGWDSSNQGRRQDFSRENSAPNQYQNFPQTTASPTSQYPQYTFPQQFQQAAQNPPFGQSLPPNMPQFPFQMPQMPTQQSQYGQFPAGAHINPAFFTALQQHQQQQQQQTQPSFSAPGAQGQAPQNQTAFNQVQAQLDILRQLTGNGNVPGGNPPR